MKILRKIIDSKSLENSRCLQPTFATHDDVGFNKVVILQSKYCSLALLKVSFEKTVYVVPDFYKVATRQ